jgi:hypothetical protein
MASTLRMSIMLFAIELACCKFVFGQVDAVELRAAFGPPIETTSRPKRERFRVRRGFDLTVSYSATNKVCIIDIGSGLAYKEEVQAVLERAVPTIDRGKIWNELKEFDGLAGFQNTYYEKIVITRDIFLSKTKEQKPGVRVLFKENECGWRAGQDPFDTPSRLGTEGNHY